MLPILKAHEIVGPLSTLCKRAGPRVRQRATNIASAAEAVGSIERGMIATGVTKGGFSMLDMIEHVLAATGPADVDVSTWTMGVYDADVLWKFAANGSIRRIRFVLDPSMFNLRDTRYAPAFLAAFGGDSIRAVENHAKFTCVGNDDWSVVICSSMNLNRNTRLENFVIFDDPGVHGFYVGIVDQVFCQVRPMSEGRRMSRAAFDALDFESDDGGRSDRQDRDDGGDPGRKRAASREAREVW